MVRVQGLNLGRSSTTNKCETSYIITNDVKELFYNKGDIPNVQMTIRPNWEQGTRKERLELNRGRIIVEVHMAKKTKIGRKSNRNENPKRNLVFCTARYIVKVRFVKVGVEKSMHNCNRKQITILMKKQAVI